MATNLCGKRTSILSNVKETYKRCYVSDELGDEINPEITFAQLLAGMVEKKDFYDMVGVSDSIMRERLFDLMAILGGIKTREIYDLWYTC